MSDKILKLSQAQTLYEDLRERIDALPTDSDIPEVPVQDVQVNGTSILNNGTANIPMASDSVLGVVRIVASQGIKINPANGSLAFARASSENIKNGVNAGSGIVPYNQHESVFYGLSKAAGTDLANEENITVGTYPAAAKTAIQTMLDVPSNAAMTTAIGNAIGNINSFDMAVVQALPTQNISTHTIYLVPKTGETNDVYDEYIYINNAWEMIGNTQIDLSNYATLQDIPNVPVQDVQVNSNSILNNGIANIPMASLNNFGVVKVNPNNYGIGINSADGGLYIGGASDTNIKEGIANYRVIFPSKQHQAVFYGLAKAAGDTTQASSANAVGTYTAEAKTAIQQMLDVPSTSDIPDISGKADKDNAVFTGSISMGRKADTEIGSESTALGYDVEASGWQSHAEGSGTVASGHRSHAEGILSVASGRNSHSEGNGSTSSGANSHSEGSGTTASGRDSHSEGLMTTASGRAAHSEGFSSIASGDYSHAEGQSTIANHAFQHVSGKYNAADTSEAASTAAGNYVEIIGNGTDDNARSNARALDWNGNEYLSRDIYVNCDNDSTAGTKVATLTDLPDMSLYAPKASPVFSGSISLGRKGNSTIGDSSVAMGSNVEASGIQSFAEGSGTTASGIYSHAEGAATIANGVGMHASGSFNVPATLYPLWISGTLYPVGYKIRRSSGTAYECIQQNSDAYLDISKWKRLPSDSDTAFVIGNSIDGNNRSNAVHIDWDGNGHYAGNIYVGANADSTGGTRLATITEVAAKLDAAEAGLKVVRLI